MKAQDAAVCVKTKSIACVEKAVSGNYLLAALFKYS
jgi:hypothetical protein